MIRHRTRLLPAFAALATAALLAACSAPADDAGSTTDEGDATGADQGETRMVEHAYGSTEVPAEPQRVVSLGWTDVENAIALGITPVGFRDWFGTGLNDWAATASDGTEPESVQTEDGTDFGYEAILALEPDLIFANDGMTQEQYDRLSDIAPTVGPIEGGDSYGVEWDVAITRTGEILGRQDEAATIVSRVRAAVERITTEHPEFAGHTAAMGFAPGPDAPPYLATSADPRFQPLLAIGLAPNEAVAALDEQGETGMIELSTEEVSKLEADLLFLYMYSPEERTDALAIPAFAALDVVKEDRVIWMPADVADALTFGTALSIEYALSKLPPLIAQKLPA